MNAIGRARNLLLTWMILAAISGACSSNGASGDGGTACGDAACGASQICRRSQTAGGAANCPGDAGTCPGGYVLDTTTGCCASSPVWSCVARPSGCGASVTCACAISAVCGAGQACSTPRENEIDCTLLAP
jgi:hypothetical protein